MAGFGRAVDASKPFVIMYHGSLVERHGLDLAVIALGKIRESIPNARTAGFMVAARHFWSR